MSIDSINFSTKTPAFKGNYKRTEQGNPYYHTNSAMKIGGTLAGLCALGTAIDLAGNNFFQKALKNLPEADKDLIKINNKTAILANGLAALAIHLGCAAFIDHKRNEKAKETADFVKKVGTKNAVMNSDEVALSNKGRAYYDSNTGAKYGGWCCCRSYWCSKKLRKSKGTRQPDTKTTWGTKYKRKRCYKRLC